jgi:hypothetical protein
VPLPSFLDLDWRRLMRWSILLSVVMTLWLLAPTAKCSWSAFRNEPLDEAHPISDTPGSHKQDVVEGDGVFSRWGSAVKYCYSRSRPLGSSSWKRTLLFVFIGGGLVCFGLSEIERRNKKKYT